MRTFLRFRLGIGTLVLVTALLLTGCRSNNDGKTIKPQLTPTLPSVAWQRPAVPISQQSATVRLTGLMSDHRSTVNSTAFAASGSRMASIGADGAVVVWNLANGEPLVSQNETGGRYVFFGPDDETLITASTEGVVQVWTVNLSPPRHLEPTITFQAYPNSTGLVVQSPDRTLLAFGALGGGIRLWQVPEGTMIAEIAAHQDAIQHLVFSPNGRWLVSVGVDRSVNVWAVPGGQLVYQLASPDSAEDESILPFRALFSPDSNLLAVAVVDGIVVWDVNTGQQLYEITAAQGAAINALAFSPDNQLLVGCGDQPLIGIWRAANGQQLGLLPIPGQTCHNAIFSPDSTLLLTLPRPGRDIYLWNVVHIAEDIPAEQKLIERADRQTLGLIPGTRFYEITWSPDGRFIVVVDELGPLYVLSAAPADA